MQHIGAGASLFSWKTDRNIFMNGPFEFRVLENPPDETNPETDPLLLVPPPWRKFIIQNRPPVSHF